MLSYLIHDRIIGCTTLLPLHLCTQYNTYTRCVNQLNLPIDSKLPNISLCMNYLEVANLFTCCQSVHLQQLSCKDIFLINQKFRRVDSRLSTFVIMDFVDVICNVRYDFNGSIWDFTMRYIYFQHKMALVAPLNIRIINFLYIQSVAIQTDIQKIRHQNIFYSQCNSSGKKLAIHVNPELNVLPN